MGGCGKDSEMPKYKEVEGRVSDINSKTSVVKMLWYNEDKQQEIELEGKLDPNADILINGVVAQLKDLRVGDRVKVVGRIEKSDGARTLFATKVDVTRPQTIEIIPTTQPKADQ
jgi:hypothetical protein